MKSNPDCPLEAVRPVRPPAAYIGGKKMLAGRLVPLIAGIPHTTYAEVFVGMGGVFFRRSARPKAEVINDWSRDVSNLFRILQRHYVPFLDMLRFELTTRSRFEGLIKLDPEGLTDLERAARFLYLQKVAFGGKVTGQGFGVSPSGPARFDLTKLVPLLEAVHERLSAVTIERLPWADFLRRYDRPGTLFYLDPPYFGSEGDYGAGMFARAEFEQMAKALRGLAGKFVLSINDHPEVRRIFDGFDMREEDVRYTLAGNGAGRNFGELIITG